MLKVQFVELYFSSLIFQNSITDQHGVRVFYILYHSIARANLKKVNTPKFLLPQHQRTFPRGPGSASIEIPPFRPQFIKFSKTVFSITLSAE